jgi:hypothetical protein
MAKLSARGCHKVASARKDFRPENALEARIVVALRSDGVVLHRYDYLHAGDARWRCGSYSVATHAMRDTAKHTLDTFTAWATARGYDLD